MQTVQVQLKQRSPEFLRNMVAFLRRQGANFKYDLSTNHLNISSIPESNKHRVLDRLIEDKEVHLRSVAQRIQDLVGQNVSSLPITHQPVQIPQHLFQLKQKRRFGKYLQSQIELEEKQRLPSFQQLQRRSIRNIYTRAQKSPEPMLAQSNSRSKRVNSTKQLKSNRMVQRSQLIVETAAKQLIPKQKSTRAHSGNHGGGGAYTSRHDSATKKKISSKQKAKKNQPQLTKKQMEFKDVQAKMAVRDFLLGSNQKNEMQKLFLLANKPGKQNKELKVDRAQMVDQQVLKVQRLQFMKQNKGTSKQRLLHVKAKDPPSKQHQSQQSQRGARTNRSINSLGSVQLVEHFKNKLKQLRKLSFGDA